MRILDLRAGTVLLCLALSSTTLWSGAVMADPNDERTAWLLSRGQTTQAVEELEARLGRNPFDPAVLNNLAVARAEQGDFFVAADLLRRAQRLAPGHAVIERNAGELDAWIASRARTGRIAAAPDDKRPRLPPEPPALWQ